MIWRRIISRLVVVAVLVVLFGNVGVVRAEGEHDYYEGVIVEIVAYGTESGFDERLEFQELEVEITSENRVGEMIEVKNSENPMYLGVRSYEKYEEGDRITLTAVNNVDGEEEFFINGKLRRPGLVSLVILFVIVVLIVGRLWGALSLLGLGISFVVIFQIVVPMILVGNNPIWAAMAGSLIIIPATFYVSHGINKKTHVGVISTIIVLALTGYLAVKYVGATYLSGLAAEEAGFLNVERMGEIDIRGLLIAGIIIGSLGILDDITVGQASVVEQIRKANKKFGFGKLFWQGMKVGQDHISSMVNTLVLVYSGSALPLILLFFDSNRALVETFEMEMIAEEIVRMLVGSIGLVLAAPLATAMAAWIFANSRD